MQGTTNYERQIDVVPRQGEQRHGLLVFGRATLPVDVAVVEVSPGRVCFPITKKACFRKACRKTRPVTPSL